MLNIFKTAYRLKGRTFLNNFRWFFLIFLSASLQAQNPPRRELDISQFIEELFPAPSEDLNYEDLFESLSSLYTNPLDLNTVTSDELAATFILSEQQIESFIEHRTKLGPFISLYELQSIPGFDINTIFRLLPFVTVVPLSLTFKESLKNPNQNFLMLRSGRILEKQKGYSSDSSSSSKYLGKPLYTYLRYRNARTGKYSFGFSLEKDGGEKWWNWKPKRQIFGADFFSFHFQLLNQGKLKNLIIGDFQMQAGQGLVMAGGFSLGTGSEVIRAAYRSTLGLRPYTSTIETGFFRGLAATYSLTQHIDITGFYSRTKRDASFDQNIDNSQDAVISSLTTSGYHRTPSEISKHNIIAEQNIGIHAIYKLSSQRGQLGITLLDTQYDSYLQKKDIPYNLFEFSGKHNFTAGFHGDYRWKNFHLFGEGARSKSGGIGGVAGLIIGLAKSVDFSFLARHYDRNFHTFYGNALSEATRPINESGNYWGLRYSPDKRWQFSIYYDRFIFPWLKYQVNAPSDGHDFYIHILWKPNKKLNAYALYREKQKPTNVRNPTLPIDPVTDVLRRNALLNFEYEVPLRFSIRSRVQFGDYIVNGGGSSKGLTIVQDLVWKRNPFELSTRIAFFKTDDYNSRQYVYEKDMLYAFSIPAYYDTGTRHYLMLRYTVSQHLKIWLRWSQTRYTKLDTISSGLNEIEGKKRSELKVQALYQF